MVLFVCDKSLLKYSGLKQEESLFCSGIREVIS